MVPTYQHPWQIHILPGFIVVFNVNRLEEMYSIMPGTGSKKKQKFLSHLKVPELQVCGRSEMEDLGNLEDRANHRITRSFSYSPEDS